MGVKTTIAGIVPAATHVSASQALGRNPSQLHQQAQTQLVDTINLLNQVVKDMTKGNPSDPNIAIINTAISNLS